MSHYGYEENATRNADRPEFADGSPAANVDAAALTGSQLQQAQIDAADGLIALSYPAAVIMATDDHDRLWVQLLPDNIIFVW